MGSSEFECPVVARAKEDPRLLFAIEDGCETTYGEFHRRVEDAMDRRLASGCGAGARIVEPWPNRVTTLAEFWALFRMRAVACPISTRMPPQMADEIRESLESVRCSSHKYRTTENDTRHDSLDESMSATTVFSSGSTGRPKAIVHTLGAHVASAKASNENIPLTQGDRWLLSLPLYHVGGLAILFRCIVAGATIVLDSRKETFTQNIVSNRVTHVSLVATQLKRILDESPSAFESTKAVLLGGGSTPYQLMRRAVDANVPLYATYGLSEMASQVATTMLLTQPTESSGRVLPHAELKVANSGEILVRGQSLMQGYWIDGSIRLGLAEGLTEDGWFRTRDRGAVDDNGNVTVMGRMDNMFISGGENVHPEEIEVCLLDIPGVRQAVVVAIPDSEFGERPVAFVDSSSLDERRLRENLFSRLERFKVPDRIYAWPEDTRAGNFKPDRNWLRQLAVDRGS